VSPTEPAATAAAVPVPGQPAGPARREPRARRLLLEYGIYVILVAVVVAATIAYHGFLSAGNLRTLLLQNVPLGITAVGMTIVLIGGGFDLSVGAVFALSGVVSAALALHGSVGLGILAGLAAALVCGAGNALVVTVLNVNPFVATLGSGTLISGATLLFTNSQTYQVSSTSFGLIGTGQYGPIPVAIIIMVAIFAIAYVAMRRTIFGRALFAVGGNREASRLSGLRTGMVTGSTYVICALLAGLAGVISASQLGDGQGSTGTDLALNAIAVVVIGGTSLTGGEGSVLRSGVGLLILASLQNIYFSLSISTYWQLITEGIVVIGAVALDVRLRRRRA
jgi:ribose transport system permease protein